jgi:hypothetical protein
MTMDFSCQGHRIEKPLPDWQMSSCSVFITRLVADPVGPKIDDCPTSVPKTGIRVLCDTTPAGAGSLRNNKVLTCRT